MIQPGFGSFCAVLYPEALFSVSAEASLESQSDFPRHAGALLPSFSPLTLQVVWRTMLSALAADLCAHGSGRGLVLLFADLGINAVKIMNSAAVEPDSSEAASAIYESGFVPTAGQRAVIENHRGDLQVIACAGSGKTESISRRVAEILRRGCKPESVVAFTFTEKAAIELKERITKHVRRLLGDDALGPMGRMFVGTRIKPIEPRGTGPSRRSP